jgi:hypothetical protein
MGGALVCRCRVEMHLLGIFRKLSLRESLSALFFVAIFQQRAISL